MINVLMKRGNIETENHIEGRHCGEMQRENGCLQAKKRGQGQMLPHSS